MSNNEISKENSESEFDVKNTFDSIKEAIFLNCNLYEDNECTYLINNGMLVGIYYPKTDTINILLDTPSGTLWNNYGLSVLVLTSQFLIVEKGTCQQSYAAWVKGICGLHIFGFYNLSYSFRNLEYSALSSNTEKGFTVSKMRLGPLGKCSSLDDKEYNLKIDLLDYEIKYHSSEIERCNNDNKDFAILGKYGKLFTDPFAREPNYRNLEKIKIDYLEKRLR